MRVSPYVTAACALLLSGAVVTFIGCDTAEPTAAGRVEVFLKDAPIDNIVSVFVTIDRVELVGGADGEEDEAAPILLTDEDQTFDLLTLRDPAPPALLADESIPEGRYGQIRLVVSEAEVVVDEGGTEVTRPLTIPSGVVRIPLPDFTIDGDGDEVEIVLDFDASQSIHEAGASGKLILRPVILPERLSVNDEELEGEADSGDVADDGASDDAADDTAETEG